jgi:hypothetical protein
VQQHIISTFNTSYTIITMQRVVHNNSSQQCQACQHMLKLYKSLKMHWAHNTNCFNTIQHNMQAQPNTLQERDNPISNEPNCFNIQNDDDASVNAVHNVTHPKIVISNNSCMQLLENFQSSRNRYGIEDNTQNYAANVELLYMLKQSKCPLYLFDSIMQWAHKSFNDTLEIPIPITSRVASINN